MKVSGICGECGKYYKGESCPRCVSMATGETVNVMMDIPEHFNRGLGEVVKGRADYRAKLKEKGMVEVGNERKYVDPVMVRKVKERELDKEFEARRPEAYRMLSHYEGAAKWN